MKTINKKLIPNVIGYNNKGKYVVQQKPTVEVLVESPKRITNQRKVKWNYVFVNEHVKKGNVEGY